MKKKKAGGKLQIIERKDRRDSLDSKLVELLSPRREIDLKINKCLEGLPDSYLVILVVSLKDYTATAIELVRLFQKDGSEGIYFTINKAVEGLCALLEHSQVDCSKIHFVDAITNVAGRKEVYTKNSYYLESPTDLIEIDTKIDELLSQPNTKRNFLVFDSISTLLIYNHPEAVEKFCHSLIGKIRGKKVRAVFLMVRSEKDKGTLEAISQFCDKAIEMS